MLKKGQHETAAVYFLNASRAKPNSAVSHFVLMIAIKLHVSSKSSVLNQLASTFQIDRTNLTALTRLATQKFLEVKDD